MLESVLDDAHWRREDLRYLSSSLTTIVNTNLLDCHIFREKLSNPLPSSPLLTILHKIHKNKFQNTIKKSSQCFPKITYLYRTTKTMTNGIEKEDENLILNFCVARRGGLFEPWRSISLFEISNCFIVEDGWEC